MQNNKDIFESNQNTKYWQNFPNIIFNLFLSFPETHFRLVKLRLLCLWSCYLNAFIMVTYSTYETFDFISIIRHFGASTSVKLIFFLFSMSCAIYHFSNRWENNLWIIRLSKYGWTTHFIMSIKTIGCTSKNPKIRSIS